ncbi:hypothetical protein TNCV_3461411 [Trichonephila clavipes]|nr:hypothetical protein TNCV_3461411 [Trichonephila clavipes]
MIHYFCPEKFEWFHVGSHSPKRGVRSELYPPQTTQDVLAASMGGAARCHTHHPPGGGTRLPRSRLLRITGRRKHKRYLFYFQPFQSSM